MRVEAGDRVRFLNEVGGGIVSRTEGSLVFVEDEDGFEVPVAMHEVVVVEKGRVEAAAPGRSPVEEDKHHNEAISEPEAYHEELEEEGHDDFNPRLYLAYIKTGNNQTETGKLQAYLINDSNYYCSYLMSELGEDGFMHALHQGSMAPNSKLELDEQEAAALDKRFHLQLLLYKKGKPYPALDPVSIVITIKARKFYRDNSFRANDFFYQPAVLFPLIKNELEQKMEALSERETRAIIREKEAGSVQPEKKAKRKSTPELLEVDLHIHELIDSSNGLTNGEILQLQMDKFHAVMQENKSAKGRRLVFIHGVGNGVLKNEIRKQLERKYKGLAYQDASFKEYGYGATMVLI